ncbi:glutathione S-transferase family protein [Pseudohongiella sp.]|uniref:GST N-terminal domain-containing protein n=1 Tax=marine sediment metagenome TaxID=412755 RepID=A0A0F9YA74_9ZZZZ|nr:glutathione S-transferase family protein [Pseudohongiella sp.]
MRIAAIIVMTLFFAGCQAANSADTTPSARAATPLPPITIYHLEARRSERIVWLMEELGFPYELEFVRGNLGASLMQIREVNPGNPVAPTVIYGDEILVESGAIIDVILNRHAPDRLQPDLNSPDYPWHQIWMHYAEGSLAARMGIDYRVWQLQPPERRSPLRDIRGTVQYAEDFLGEHPYFGGSEFSAADIMMHFPMNYTFLINVVDRSQYPNINEWMERVEARPAYQRMAEVSKPDGMPSPPVPLPDSSRPPL